MVKRIRQLAASLLDLCFPRRCAGCQQTWLLAHEGFWCRTCLPDLPWIEAPLCPRCGCPFPDSAGSSSHLCGDCLKGTFAFDWARSATSYAGTVRERIHQLKFGGQLHFVPPLVELLLLNIMRGEELPEVDMVLPVPLHPRRIKQRGFNQAALIAQLFGKRSPLPVPRGVLIRQRWTEPQTRLGRRERLQNVKGAFALTNPSVVRDRAVLIIDDVFTTGTTIDECARVLKHAGAGQVCALTIARALPDRADDFGKTSHGGSPLVTEEGSI